LLKNIFWKHTEPSIFTKVAATFKFFLGNDEEYAGKQNAESHYNNLVREMAKKLGVAITSFQDSDDDEDNDEDGNHFALQVALLRIKHFISVVDFSLYN